MKQTILAIAISLTFSTYVIAAPDVEYQVSGTPGDWLLDFKVTNTLGVPEMDIYFFGVALPARDIINSPVGWNPNTWTVWDNLVFGGSGQSYNNNWIETVNGPDSIQMGEALSGFQARVSGVVAPTSVKWFAYGYGATGALYLAGDNFNQTYNPGFEGITSIIPEPATWTALMLAAVSLGLSRRR